MENDEDLFGFGQQTTSGQGSKSVAGNDNPDDLFSSLATRHSLDQESSAMEFDPFGDNLWKNTNEPDPFDLGSLSKPFTTTTTTSTSTSVSKTATTTPALNDDLADLLNFDTTVTTTTTTTPILTGSLEESKQPENKSTSSLFSDLDPFSPTVNTEQSKVLQPTLCVSEDDPFEVKPVLEADLNLPGDDVKPMLGGNKKNKEIDIFESMKMDMTDPFSMDPFSTPIKTDSLLITSEPPTINQTTTGADAWLESLTFSDKTAPPGEITNQTSGLSSGDETGEQVDRLDTDVTMTEDETPVITQSADKQVDKMIDTEENSENSLDLSVIEDTAHLDIEALKQKTSLRKKGSLALRRKPSRKGVRNSLLSVANQFEDIDSNDTSSSKKDTSSTNSEVQEEGSTSVAEKHDVEKPENENKPPAAERPSVLRRGAPPGGQMVIPGLADIGKVKLRSSPVKPLTGSRPSSIASGLSQPVSLPKVQLRSSQRSSLILPKSDTTTTTTTSKKSVFHSLFTKPQPKAKPQVAASKPKLSETKDASLKKDGKPHQPSWLRRPKEPRLASGSEELSVKHQQEKEPEKPAWLKASNEKRQKSTDSVTKEVETKSNKENNLSSSSRLQKVHRDPATCDPDLGQSSENRLNELNTFQTQKSSTESGTEEISTVLVIENTLMSSSGLCVSDLSLNKKTESSNKNGHKTDSTTADEKEEVVRRPKLSPRPDYTPSWSNQGNKVLPGVESDQHNQSSGELPKWKRDLLEKRKQKPADVAQVDSPSNETNVPTWQKELKNRRRSSIKQKDPVGDSNPSKEPEWMRKAEERRARLAKSGLIEK